LRTLRASCFSLNFRKVRSTAESMTLAPRIIMAVLAVSRGLPMTVTPWARASSRRSCARPWLPVTTRQRAPNWMVGRWMVGRSPTTMRVFSGLRSRRRGMKFS